MSEATLTFTRVTVVCLKYISNNISMEDQAREAIDPGCQPDVSIIAGCESELRPSSSYIVSS